MTVAEQDLRPVWPQGAAIAAECDRSPIQNVRFRRVVLDQRELQLVTDVHPNLTVVVVPPGQVEHTCRLVSAALVGADCGVHVELTDAQGRNLLLFRPHGGRSRVLDLDRQAEALAPMLPAGRGKTATREHRPVDIGALLLASCMPLTSSCGCRPSNSTPCGTRPTGCPRFSAPSSGRRNRNRRARRRTTRRSRRVVRSARCTSPALRLRAPRPEPAAMRSRIDRGKQRGRGAGMRGGRSPATSRSRRPSRCAVRSRRARRRARVPLRWRRCPPARSRHPPTSPCSPTCSAPSRRSGTWPKRWQPCSTRRAGVPQTVVLPPPGAGAAGVQLLLDVLPDLLTGRQRDRGDQRQRRGRLGPPRGARRSGGHRPGPLPLTDRRPAPGASAALRSRASWPGRRSTTGSEWRRTPI